jgi:UDP-N-acetyl-D-mannosaminuronic acid dehydrogenase
MTAVPTTDHMADLARRIARRDCVIGVVGLGYVGLPLACCVADAGFTVVGVDRDAARVDRIAAGHSPIEGEEPGMADLLAAQVAGGRLRVTTDYAQLASAELITLNVDTPVDDLDHRPRYEALRSAVTSLAPVLRDRAVVIVESTVSPGTTTNVVSPLLAELTGGAEGERYFVAACPERVMPGRLLHNLRAVPRVCGATHPGVAAAMRAFYSTFVDAEIDTTDPTTAEMVKVTENTYRDVQIAFANEVALIAEDLGIDVWHLRELVNKVPFRAMHEPGGGVGGHCIPKDPWLLASAATEPGGLRVIPAARAVNDGMPLHVADVTLDRVVAHRRRLGLDPAAPTTVAVLGYSYLPESDDVRNSPSEALVAELRRRDITVRIHDPHVPAYLGSIDQAVADVDAVVVMVPHRAYDSLTFHAPVVVNARRLLDGRDGDHDPRTST